jgi:hypothetical protein
MEGLGFFFSYCHKYSRWWDLFAFWSQAPCHNSNLGLMTKARGCKVVGQEGSLVVMPHAPRSARECEGINLHIPKGTPTLGVGVHWDSWMFKERLHGSKPNGLKSYLYHWKDFET